MKVEKVMTTDVVSCHPQDGLDVAAGIMWQRDCGCVPVVDDDSRVLGMITDRDLCMAAYTQGKPIRDIPVSRAMSPDVWSCRPDGDVEEAERVMREHQVRRLPVTDANGRIAGLLSLSDLVQKAGKNGGSRAREQAIKYAEVGEILKAVSAPRARARASAP